MFVDRPVWAPGHALTSHLLEEWGGSETFSKDPANGAVAAYGPYPAYDELSPTVRLLPRPALLLTPSGEGAGFADAAQSSL
jgi:hypothetical protein